MRSPKAKFDLMEHRSRLVGSALHPNKNVQNGDKFEKFEILKERFKIYRENVLKIGFDSLLSKTHQRATSFMSTSCCNFNSNVNAFNHISASSPNSMLNINSKDHDKFCPCSFCAYCAQHQQMLTEIAYLNNLEHDIKEIRNFLRVTRKKLENRELKAKIALDWKRAALVLDRTFFFVYLIITLVTIFLMFPKHHFMSKSL